jgi:hypothetical protein
VTAPNGPPNVEECEDNDCTGCPWCDATPADDCREWDDGTMGGRDQFEGES